MIHPEILVPRPSTFLSILGGLVGMLLFSALLHLTPVFGFPLIDFAALIGGVFTANPQVAFWIGFLIFFLTGVFIFAPLLGFFWPLLPGRRIGFGGAIIKGLLWGILLWVASGLLMPLVGAINRLAEIENPGFFVLGNGLIGALWFLVAHLVFGLATALIAAMGQGINPLDTLGWDGHTKADTRQVILEQEGRGGP